MANSSECLSIMKEVESFIEQIKREEGELFDSNSSIFSETMAMTFPLEIENNTSDDNTLESYNSMIKINFEENNILNNGIQNREIIMDSNSKKLNDIVNDKINPTDNDYYLTLLGESHENKMDTHNKDIKYKLKENKINKSFEDINLNTGEIYCKTDRQRKQKEDDSSCDSSYIDLGSDNERSKVSYILWLQQKRCGLNMPGCNFHDNEREIYHSHQVNSALFWERWMDFIFETFDSWTKYSSDSEDEEIRSRTGNLNSRKNYKRNLTMAYETDELDLSEIKIRRPLTKLCYAKSLRYKSPSYTDWLMQRRSQNIHSESEESSVTEVIKSNYWSSLYGRLTNSLSLLLIRTKNGEDEEKEKKGSQSVPLLSGQGTKQSLWTSRTKRSWLRKSNSHTCGDRNNPLESKIRYKRLSQESVESPVLTDQLVELVCNTLSPESSEDTSSSDIETYRKHKWLHRRKTNRKL